MKHKFYFVLVGLMIALFAGIGSLYAAETVTHEPDGKSPEPGVKFSVTEYSRVGSTVELQGPVSIPDINACNDPGVTCKNLTGSNINVTYRCDGFPAGDGGWQPGIPTGQCWSNLDVCYYAGTINETCYKLSGSSDSPEMRAGITAHKLCESGGGTSTGNGKPNSNKKGLCSFDYDDSGNLETNSQDDMFSLKKDRSGFVEYQKLPANNDWRLIYLKRDQGGLDKSLMIPSGPFVGTSQYSDYTNFMENPPDFVTVEKGCYPVDFTLCYGPAALPPPKVDGVCGAAQSTLQPAHPTVLADQCSKGLYVDVADDFVNNKWLWRCDGLSGGATANCEASMPTDGICDNLVHNGCISGTVNDAAYADTALEWRWRCDSVGGNSPMCLMTIPTGTPGACDNSAQNACAVGTANDAVLGDTTTHYRWRCDSPDGGPPSGACSILKTTPINGVCDNGVRNSCSAGTYVNVADTASEWRWRCNGVNGGTASGVCSKPKTAPPKTCTSGVDRDIVFVVDDSGSIGTSNFEIVRDFMQALSTELGITGADSIALTKFSTHYNAKIDPTTSTSGFNSSVESLIYSGCGTRIDLGLLAGANLMASKNGNGKTKTIILITDGVSAGTPLQAAFDIKSGGYRIVAVGIGSFDRAQLEEIKSSDTVLYNTDFANLGSISDEVAQAACETSSSNYTYSTQPVPLTLDNACSSGFPGGGDPGAGCFVAETRILMADGSEKPIGDIEIGDMVMSFSKAGPDEVLKPQRVTHFFVMGKQSTYNLHGTLVTGEHPFMTASGEMMKLEEMDDSTWIVMGNGNVIRRGPLVKGPVREVYNMTVENTHSYIADGMRVGNMTFAIPQPEGVYNRNLINVLAPPVMKK